MGGNHSANFYSGRVEMRWEVAKPDVGYSTICDDNFDDREAIVICKMLGFNYGIARKGAYFGRGTGKIELDDLKCDGEEKNIYHCGHNGRYRHNCNHGKDAGVECSNVPIRGRH